MAAGFTVLELLVVTALLVLLFTLVGTGVSRGSSLTQAARQRLAQQDQARLALEKLALDLRHSARVATVVGAEQLAVQTILDWNPDGSARWRNGWIVYFRDSENRLRRWVQPATPPETTHILPLTPEELGALVVGAADAAHLCQGVEDLQLQWSGTRVLRVGIRLGDPSANFRLSLSVRLRNGS